MDPVQSQDSNAVPHIAVVNSEADPNGEALKVETKDAAEPLEIETTQSVSSDFGPSDIFPSSQPSTRDIALPFSCSQLFPDSSETVSAVTASIYTEIVAVHEEGMPRDSSAVPPLSEDCPRGTATLDLESETSTSHEEQINEKSEEKDSESVPLNIDSVPLAITISDVARSPVGDDVEETVKKRAKSIAAINNIRSRRKSAEGEEARRVK